MAINNNISNKERIVLVDGINDEQALELTPEYPFAVFFTNDETTPGYDTLKNNIYKGGRRFTKFQNVDKTGVYIGGHKICLGYDENTGIVRLYDAHALNNMSLVSIGVCNTTNDNTELVENYVKDGNNVDIYPKDINGSYIVISDKNVYTLRFKFEYSEDDGTGNMNPAYGFVDLSSVSNISLGIDIRSANSNVDSYVTHIANHSYAETIPEATSSFPTSHPYFHTSRKAYKAVSGTQINGSLGDRLSYVTVNEKSGYDVSVSSGDININQYIVGEELSFIDHEDRSPISSNLEIDLSNSMTFSKEIECIVSPSNAYDQHIEYHIEYTTTGNGDVVVNSTGNTQRITLSGTGECQFTVIATLDNDISVAMEGGSSYTYSKPISASFNVNVVDNNPYYWYVSDNPLPNNLNQMILASNISDKGFHSLSKDVINYSSMQSIVDLKEYPIIFDNSSNEAKKYYIAVPTGLPNGIEIVPGHDLDQSGAEFGNDEWEFSKSTKIYNNTTYTVYSSYNSEVRYSGKLFIKKN